MPNLEKEKLKKPNSLAFRIAKAITLSSHQVRARTPNSRWI
jgi:hypothetical protein